MLCVGQKPLSKIWSNKCNIDSTIVNLKKRWRKLLTQQRVCRKSREACNDFRTSRAKLKHWYPPSVASCDLRHEKLSCPFHADVIQQAHWLPQLQGHFFRIFHGFYISFSWCMLHTHQRFSRVQKHQLVDSKVKSCKCKIYLHALVVGWPKPAKGTGQRSRHESVTIQTVHPLGTGASGTWWQMHLTEKQRNYNRWNLHGLWQLIASDTGQDSWTSSAKLDKISSAHKISDPTNPITLYIHHTESYINCAKKTGSCLKANDETTRIIGSQTQSWAHGHLTMAKLLKSVDWFPNRKRLCFHSLIWILPWMSYQAMQLWISKSINSKSD